MIQGRLLKRNEIRKIWTIDRSETFENSYYLEKGQLKLKAHYFEAHGWPPDEDEKYTPVLLDCFDRGGWFYALFDKDALIAIAVLEAKFIGREDDQLQLLFFHVSSPYRGQGLGKRLFELAKTEALSRGARRLYISATPTENTIRFYLKQGCHLMVEPDPELFALEPEDIHLECPI
ncbi:MAG: GNAT family N-acetyltransferase [Trueperaceae bacterium]|nr:GNAT family N-acetyltransferase [Trueperaceae bacterium]